MVTAARDQRTTSALSTPLLWCSQSSAAADVIITLFRTTTAYYNIPWSHPSRYELAAAAAAASHDHHHYGAAILVVIFPFPFPCISILFDATVRINNIIIVIR